MYTCHFSLYRKELIEAVGGVRPGFEGSQDYDLMLRVSERTRNIFHIPRILYHWRKGPSSTATEPRAKGCSSNAGLRALQEHCRRTGVAAEVMLTDVPNSYCIRPLIQGNPLVSIIIPHKDHPEMLANCISKIQDRTSYRNYELLIVDNGSSSRKAQDYLRSLPYRVIPFNEPFNFSRLNNLAIRESNGDYALLLNDDTEVISSDWLSAMVGYAQLPEIGAVGAKLFFADGSIQHCGVVLGIRGVAGHWLRRFPGNSRGYFNSLFRTRNFSAVTAACVLFRREVFESVGGFDENLPYAFNDVDFCLRIRSAGYRVVWVPDAELYHYETVTRPLELDPGEVRYLKKKWGTVLLNDPYYNVNLGLDSEALSLRF
jgi:O-antigen biosynthesis protein